MPSNPPLAYVAGPYRAATPLGVTVNVNRARQVGVLVAERGWHPIVPHNLSTGLEHVGDDDFWLALTLNVMEKCDVVVVAPNWQASDGTRAEIARAEELGLPVYFDVGELPAQPAALEVE